MTVLDTHVVADAMNAAPNPAVPAWPDEQAAETHCLSSVTLANCCPVSAPCHPAGTSMR